MTVAREPNKDRKLPLSDLLTLLQQQVGLGGPLQDQLTQSLQRAQLESLKAPSTIDQRGDVITYDQNNESDTKMAFAAFNNRILAIRRVRPVLYFNIPAIEEQKGSPATGRDLGASFEYMRDKVRPVQKEEFDPNGEMIHPLFEVNYYTGKEHISVGELIAEVGFFAQNFGTRSFALHYSEYGSQLEVNNFLFMQSRSLHQGLFLVSTHARTEIMKDYQSPWLNKVNYAQLRKLQPDSVPTLLKNFEEVLDPNNPDRVRYLVADYGSGKTATLEALQELAIPDASYIIKLVPLAEQNDVLDGRVIFVDEAVVWSRSELKEIKEAVERNDGVAIMLVQNTEVKRIVEERIGS
jgi:hypothetical protein